MNQPSSIRKAPLALFVLSMVIGGCASQRPHGVDCGLDRYVQSDTGWAPFALPDADASQLNVLVLSAGGEYGAYGTGFLRGWSEVPNANPITPSELTVVTGVSTGAIIATHAFLGRFVEASNIYESIRGSQVYRQRSFLSLLWSNSLTDASGKDKLIEQYIDAQLIDAVAREYSNRPARKLLVGTVDLDSGRFLRIDLSKLAADTSNVNRDACFRAAVGAAAAIPLAFPPVFVDSRMLVDGGLRHYAFLQNIDIAFQGPKVKRRMFAFYHGDLSAGAETTGNGILPIASRSLSVVGDEAIKDTAYRLDYVARLAPFDQRFDTYYANASAASKSCAPTRNDPLCRGGSAVGEEDMFCQPFMRCLSAKGREDGLRAATEGAWTRELMTSLLGSTP